MTQVLCVLRSGGDFGPEHVDRLYRQVMAHAPAHAVFSCLTDVNLNGAFHVRRLGHDWPGWWAKMEALAVPGPCLYLDLDVSVVGDLWPLLDATARHDLIMCRDFWGCAPSQVNSSIMGWRGDVSGLYREFADAPAAHMSIYGTRERWGDQAFVRDTYAGEPALWQDALPGTVLSFKRGVLMGENATNARVIVSHGKPRPWADGGADGWVAVNKSLLTAAQS